MSNFVERRRYDCAALPKGWKREESFRRSGLTSGKIDICYYSPCGKRFRSKSQLSRFLGEAVDLSAFDYRTGKINNNGVPRKLKRAKGTLFDYSRGMKNDATVTPPIRQTASIFKQPVTVVRSQPSFKAKDQKPNSQDSKQLQEKPKQVFWEKRLQGLRSSDTKLEQFYNIDLPNAFKAIGPVDDQTVLQGIVTALHVYAGPITGQDNQTNSFEKNPLAFANTDQPFVAALHVSEDDILTQEEKVDHIRIQLQQALKETKC